MPLTHYATTQDGVSIAWQSFGDGPIDLVTVPGLASHVELMWDIAVFVYLRRRQASFARVVVFDKRGSGLSDHQLGTPEDRMNDIIAVMDAAAVEQAVIEATSEAGPLSIMFAANHPDRVDKLVLVCTYARNPVSEERYERFASWLEKNWGKGAVAELGWMGLEADDKIRQILAGHERAMSTPRNVARLVRQNMGLDCRDLLGSITAPTLVVHRRDDPMVPVECGYELARGIPGAEFVELPGAFQVPGTIDQAEAQAEVIQRWLTGSVGGGTSAERILSTVLFADIAGSTERLSAVGDGRWLATLEAFDGAARRVIERHKGRLIKFTGDGLLATLDSPARAVEAARALRSDARNLGLSLRMGIHTGEVELRGDDVAGVAVHVASRVADTAEADEIWVSPTVPVLTAGSGIDYVDRGTHTLKGIDDAMPLSAVVS